MGKGKKGNKDTGLRVSLILLGVICAVNVITRMPDSVEQIKESSIVSESISSAVTSTVTTTSTTATTTTIKTTVATTEPTEPPTNTPTQPPTELPTSPAVVEENGQIVYYTATGSKYHYNDNCGRGTYYPCTLDTAISMGLEPCEKCVH